MNVTVMGWPLPSPDVNLVENHWSISVHRVYEGGKQYTDVFELKVAIYIAETFSTFFFFTDYIHHCSVVSSELQVVREQISITKM